jgi:hypothetical protein
MQREVGATATRLFVGWAQAEPSPGQWQWQQFDQSYQQIVAGGLRPLVVAFAAPCWTTPNSGCGAFTASPPDPAHDPQWVSFVQALAARYPKAIGIEIWSEPNLASNFWPHPDPARYTQLLKEGYGAVKSVNPAMPVVSGGLLLGDGAGIGAGGEASRTFLAGMYAAGAERYMDALGIHIYPSDPATGQSPQVWDPAAMTRWLDQVTVVTRAAAVTAKPLWVTEMGVSTATQPGFPVSLTPQQQGSELDTLIQQAKADPQIRMVLIHTLQDAYPNLAFDLISNIGGGTIGDDVFYNEINEGFGVFTSAWALKPAACVVSRAFGGSLAC